LLPVYLICFASQEQLRLATKQIVGQWSTS